MDFNDSRTWLTPELHRAPPFDADGYQKRIDAICGLNEFGKPNVVLTWAPSPENYNPVYCEWDAAGFGTEVEYRAQFVFETLTNEKGDTLELPPPRWALKQFVPPAFYAAHDNQVRWSKRTSAPSALTTLVPGMKRIDGTQEGSQVWLRELRPPRPVDGYYVPLMTVGYHNRLCCRQMRKVARTCYGTYREPDESYLEWLRAAVRLRAESGEERPDAGFTPKVLKRAAAEAAAKLEQQQKDAETTTFELISENLGEIVKYMFRDDAEEILAPLRSYSFKSAGDSGIIIATK